MRIEEIILRPRKDWLLAIILTLFVIWNCLLQIELSELKHESQAMRSSLDQMISSLTPRFIPAN